MLDFICNGMIHCDSDYGITKQAKITKQMQMGFNLKLLIWWSENLPTELISEVTVVGNLI